MISQLGGSDMKRHISYLLIIFLLVSNVTFMHSANAEKIGATCKKLNGKSWSGNTPIVCKKNSKGKLVWTKFSPSPAPEVSYTLAITIEEVWETSASSSSAVSICNDYGYRFPDINKQSVIEIRDGNGKVLATSFLGDATVLDDGTYPRNRSMDWYFHTSNCVFNPVLKLKKSDFYQIRLSDRLDTVFSFEYLVSKNWQIKLWLGS